MSLLGILLPANLSFRKQLLITVTVGVVFLALSASLATSWLFSRDSRDNLIEQGLNIADNLSKQSVLALLYGSSEVAVDSAAATLVFPDVKRVTITDKDNNLILEMGGSQDSVSLIPHDSNVTSAIIQTETPDVLHITAPVFSEIDNDPNDFFGSQDITSEYLGYVHVVMSKESLKNAQTKIFIQNITVSLLIAALMATLLIKLVNRVTDPVKNLEKIMSQAEKGNSNVIADTNGPEEISHMAIAFNQMMATLKERDKKLREHNETLEYKVVLRTKELVAARDEALTASRHKSLFLANMSHELRTPMNSIMGYTEMVLDDIINDDFDSKQAAIDLKKSIKSSDHLLTLINNILDISKIEAGHMEIYYEPIMLQYIINEVADTLQPLISKNNNEMEVHITDNHDDDLIFDEIKLRQILINLLSNAAKFTQNGIIKLEADLKNESLTISVSDTGIGISEKELAIIFDEFKQADMKSTRKYGGTGLGLAISRRFCEMMGGKISVKSTIGAGTTFTIYFPLPLEKNKLKQIEQ